MAGPNDPITPTTELEAVNIILGNIGESPVSTLITPGLADVASAQSILREVSQAVQKEGWFWNTDLDVSIPLDINDEIPLPPNFLRVSTMPDLRNIQVVERGRGSGGPAGRFLLWRNPPERTGPTFDLSGVNVDLRFKVVVGLIFDDLPETARRLITIRAARVFAGRNLGDPTTDSFSQTDEDKAEANLESEEAEQGDYNILDSTHALSIIRGPSIVPIRR